MVLAIDYFESAVLEIDICPLEFTCFRYAKSAKESEEGGNHCSYVFYGLEELCDLFFEKDVRIFFSTSLLILRFTQVLVVYCKLCKLS